MKRNTCATCKYKKVTEYYGRVICTKHPPAWNEEYSMGQFPAIELDWWCGAWEKDDSIED